MTATIPLLMLADALETVTKYTAASAAVALGIIRVDASAPVIVVKIVDPYRPDDTTPLVHLYVILPVAVAVTDSVTVDPATTV